MMLGDFRTERPAGPPAPGALPPHVHVLLVAGGLEGVAAEAVRCALPHRECQLSVMRPPVSPAQNLGPRQPHRFQERSPPCDGARSQDLAQRSTTDASV